MNGKTARLAPDRARLWIEEDSGALFAEAIRAGVLSEDPEDENFAGYYMYMHHDGDGTVWFKHRDTRAYVRLAPRKGAASGNGAARGNNVARGDGATAGKGLVENEAAQP